MTNDMFDFDMDLEGSEESDSFNQLDTMILPEPTGGMKPEPVAMKNHASIVAQATNNTNNTHSIENLYLDLETIPDYERQHLFNLPPLPTVPPENTPDSLLSPAEFLTQGLDEIKKWLSKNNPPEEWLLQVEAAERSASGKKGNRKGLFDAVQDAREGKNAIDDALKANRKKMATTPEMCQIVCLGLAADDGEIVTLLAGEDGVTEESILTTFWQMAVKSQRIVGFNLANFDLPVIFFRSILLGIPATRLISTAPHHGHLLDLQIARFGRIPEKGMGLKQIAKLCHIEVPSGDVNGGDVERLMNENPQMVKIYQASDVHVTRKIHGMYRGYFCQ